MRFDGSFYIACERHLVEQRSYLDLMIKLGLLQVQLTGSVLI